MDSHRLQSTKTSTSSTSSLNGYTIKKTKTVFSSNSSCTSSTSSINSCTYFTYAHRNSAIDHCLIFLSPIIKYNDNTKE